MKLKHLTVAVPLFFEATFGTMLKFGYNNIWIYTYAFIPRHTNIKAFIWIFSRPSYGSFMGHFALRRKEKYGI